MALIADLARDGSADTPRDLPEAPARWSLTNWPIRWKLLVIITFPTLLAIVFASIQIYNSAAEAADLQLASYRAEMVRPIESYLAALEGTLLASPAGGPGEQAARETFDSRREELQQLIDTDVTSDIRSEISTILNAGASLSDGVESNYLAPRDRVALYAPIVLTAQDAVNGLLPLSDEQIRAAAEGISRAVGARAHATMQRLLIEQSGMPEPDLRVALMTLAGTDPAILIEADPDLGVSTQDVEKLKEQIQARMAILADPTTILGGNPQLLASLQITEEVISSTVLANTSASVLATLDSRAEGALALPLTYAVIAGVGLIAGLVLAALVARSVTWPLRRLRASVLRIAHKDLPAEIAQIQAGGGLPRIEPVPVYTSEEIGEVADGFDELHSRILLIACNQWRLQLQIGDMVETLSLRGRSLADQELAHVLDLERREPDPRRRDELFKLGHLASRIRRNATNLLVIADSKVRREQSTPVSVVNVINAAAAQVNGYRRVMAADLPDQALVGAAAGDVAQLLAELIENALRYSQPKSTVNVSAVCTPNGELVIEVSDSGPGIGDGDLRILNNGLEAGGQISPYTKRHVGLFIVGRLAARNGLAVWLRRSSNAQLPGTTAAVRIPGQLIAVRPGTAAQTPEDTVFRTRVPTPAKHLGNGDSARPAANSVDESSNAAMPHARWIIQTQRPDASAKHTKATTGIPRAAQRTAEPSNGLIRKPSSLSDYADTIFQGMLTEFTEAVALVPQSWETWHYVSLADERAAHSPGEGGTDQDPPVAEQPESLAEDPNNPPVPRVADPLGAADEPAEDPRPLMNEAIRAARRHRMPRRLLKQARRGLASPDLTQEPGGGL